MYIKDKMVIDSVAKAVMSIMDEENKKLLLEPEKGEKHEDEAEDKKLIKKMVKKSCHVEGKGNQPQETFTDNNMGEMTDDQMKERERIVKGMKKGIAGFKERYGQRAKDVMYATATKKAMGEDDHKGNKINPKEFEDKLDKKYGKPSPCVSDVKEATEKPTHIVSKELLSDHKRWMDSEGFDTHTVPLPKSHPKHGTHIGIVAKNNNEAGYHEDGFARPIHESVESINELSKSTLASYTGKAYKDQGVRMAKAGMMAGLHMGATGQDITKKELKKAVGKDEIRKDKNRDAGVKRALGRLSKESTELEEGSGSKEKQKTPYRNINSSEYRTAADKQKEKMEKDDAATPGKKLLSRLKGGQYKLDKNQNGKLDAHDFKLLRGEKNESVEELDEIGQVPTSRAKSLAIEAYKKIKKESMLGQVGTSEEKKK